MVNLRQIFKKDANILPSRMRVRDKSDNAPELEEGLGLNEAGKNSTTPDPGILLTFVS